MVHLAIISTTEQALGSAVDLWTAFRENGFPQKQQPWVGYVFLVEQTSKSTSPVRLQEPHFKVRPEFENTSYLDMPSFAKSLCRSVTTPQQQ